MVIFGFGAREKILEFWRSPRANQSEEEGGGLTLWKARIHILLCGDCIGAIGDSTIE